MKLNENIEKPDDLIPSLFWEEKSAAKGEEEQCSSSMLGQRPKEITSENEFWMELRISRTGMIEITGELCWTENFQIAV